MRSEKPEVPFPTTNMIKGPCLPSSLKRFQRLQKQIHFSTTYQPRPLKENPIQHYSSFFGTRKPGAGIGDMTVWRPCCWVTWGQGSQRGPRAWCLSQTHMQDCHHLPTRRPSLCPITQGLVQEGPPPRHTTGKVGTVNVSNMGATRSFSLLPMP